MSAISEIIVREYFESLGFLVRQPRKYVVASRAKRAEEEIDLVVYHPQVVHHRLPGEMVWTGADLKYISSAVLGIRGWYTENFSPAVLKLSPEVFRFAQPDSMSRVSEVLGVMPAAKIICLPNLPASATLRKKTLEMLKENGVDGVILFRTMLLELAAGVDAHKNYERSDVLQILRILKNYDLLKDAQMDLFRRGKRRNK